MSNPKPSLMTTSKMLTGQNYRKDKMRNKPKHPHYRSVSTDSEGGPQACIPQRDVSEPVSGGAPALTMRYRTLIMYVEIGSFVSCLCGWILVSSTLPTEYWTFSEVGSIVLTTANYYSNLWRDCISDTTGVSDCKDYPSMLGLPGKIHRLNT